MASKLPKTLLEAVEKKKCIVFVGAGASIPFSLPNWDQLILEIAEFCDTPSDKIARIKQKIVTRELDFLSQLEQYIDRKDEIKATLIGEKFFLDDLDYIDPRLDKHKRIFEFSSKIITTNYDNILDTIAVRNNIRKIVWNYDNDLNKISSGEKFLFKLHGDVTDSTGCILFKADYDKLYPESGDETNITLKLKSLLTENNCLFWGYSLSDTQIKIIFLYIKKLFKGSAKEHFIILKDSAKKYDYKEFNLKPIYINSFDEITELFNSLTSLTTKTRRKDIPVHYKHKYIGRENEKKEIKSFINGKDQFLIIYGPGGIGKTHLVFSQIDEEKTADWIFIRATKDMSVIDFCKIINKDIDDSMDYENAVLSNIEVRNLKIVIDDFYEVSDPRLYKLVLSLRQIQSGKLILVTRALPRQLQETLHDIISIKVNLLNDSETLDLIQELFEKNSGLLHHVALTEEILKKIALKVKGYPLLINYFFIQLNTPFANKDEEIETIPSSEINSDSEIFERLLSSVIRKGTPDELELLKDFCVFNEPVYGESFGKLKNYNLKAFQILFNKGTIWLENEKYFIHPFIKEIIKKTVGENIFANSAAGEYYEEQINKSNWENSKDYIKKAYLHYKSHSQQSVLFFLEKMNTLYGKERVSRLILNIDYEIIEKIEFRKNEYPQDLESLLYSFKNNFLNHFIVTEEKFEYFEKALRELNLANPTHLVLLQYMGIFYMKKAKYFKNEQYINDSIKYLSEGLRLEEKNVVTLSLIGQAYRDLKDYEIAIRYLERALEINPNDEKIYNVLGITYRKWGHIDKAIQYLQKAIKVNPDNIESFNELGIIYRDNIRDYDKAIFYFDEVLRVNRKDVAALNGKAIALERLEKNEDAIECLLKAIKINPRHMHSLTELGKLFRIKGDLPLSVEYLEKANAISPKDLPVLSQMGLTYAKMDLYTKAETTYKHALNISNGKHIPSLINLGYLYLNNNRPDLLVDLWRSAYNNNRLSPKHSKIYLSHMNNRK